MAYGETSLSATTNAAGVCTVTIKPDGRQTWIVSQITVEMASAPGNATCELRKQGVLITPAVPQGDPLGGDPPIQLRRNETAVVTWRNCTPGAVGTVLVIYDDGT